MNGPNQFVMKHNGSKFVYKTSIFCSRDEVQFVVDKTRSVQSALINHRFDRLQIAVAVATMTINAHVA